MMKLSTSFLLLFIASTSIKSHAQGSYQKGFVVTNANDTVHGYIDERKWTRNPRSIKFKKAEFDTKEVIHSVSTIRYFEITGADSYKRYVVTVSMNSTASPSDKSGSSNITKTDTVFLKIIQTGKTVELYSYRDKMKTRFYVLVKGDSLPDELAFKRVLVGQSVNNIDLFKNQLMTIAIKTKKISEYIKRLIANAGYYESDLSKIVTAINEEQHGNREPLTRSINKENVTIFKSNAQTNYQKGFVVTEANDTLHGYIDQ